MKKMILKVLINMGAFYLAAKFFPSITLTTLESGLWAGVVLGIVNLLVRPLLLLLTFPINMMTLGLFTLVVNTMMIMLTDQLVTGLNIPGFGLAFLTALVVSGANIIFNMVWSDD